MLQREDGQEVTSLCILCLSAPLRQKRTVRTLGFAAEGQRSGEAQFLQGLELVGVMLSAPSSDPSERMPAHGLRGAFESESRGALQKSLEWSLDGPPEVNSSTESSEEQGPLLWRKFLLLLRRPKVLCGSLP